MQQSATPSNPYAAPTSHVADPPVAVVQAFYVVALRKYWVLMIATTGLYALYWFYKNWALQRATTGESIWPVPRAIFSIFFTFALLDRVSSALRARGLSDSIGATAIATTYILAAVISSVCDRLAWRDIGTPWTALASMACLLPMAWALSRAQRFINTACSDEQGTINAQFTGLNWLWVAIGVALWSLAILGLVLPDVPAS
jgi:hypothetical protein